MLRAIKPQNKLSYRKGKSIFVSGEAISIIKPCYMEQMAMNYINSLELCLKISVLCLKETRQDFLFRALDLRQRVIFASKEKSASVMAYDYKLVQIMTLHALSTGMKDENIRYSFDITLSREGLSDEN